MTSSQILLRTLTPPQVANRLRVSPEKVIAWIRAGELRAIDVASRGSRRSRYRIDPADLAVFENQRAVITRPAPSRRRRKAEPGVIQFF
ncbi:MAG: helix-turn-helix domain-containing protein [Planctomycetota bacterium]